MDVLKNSLPENTLKHILAQNATALLAFAFQTFTTDSISDTDGIQVRGRDSIPPDSVIIIWRNKD